MNMKYLFYSFIIVYSIHLFCFSDGLTGNFYNVSYSKKTKKQMAMAFPLASIVKIPELAIWRLDNGSSMTIKSLYV